MNKFVSAMIKYVPLSRLRKKHSENWIDKLSFAQILLIWILITIVFGGIYFIFAGDTHKLISTDNNAMSPQDYMYFSFITATTTGFGDIIPKGNFKILAIFEVITGLLLLAIVTSKLVSIRQSAILEEIYELTHNDKLNRIRGSLLLSRQNINILIEKLDDGIIKKRDISNLHIILSSIESTLEEATIITKPKKEFLQKMDPVSLELLLSSVNHTFESVLELLSSIEKAGHIWKSELNNSIMNSCINHNKALINNIQVIKNSDTIKINVDLVSKLTNKIEENT